MKKFNYIESHGIFQIAFEKSDDSNCAVDFDKLQEKIVKLREILPFKTQISLHPKLFKELGLDIICTSVNVSPEDAEVARQALLKDGFNEVDE